MGRRKYMQRREREAWTVLHFCVRNTDSGDSRACVDLRWERRKGGREEGREGGREGGRERGRERWRERGREGGRNGGRGGHLDDTGPVAAVTEYTTSTSSSTPYNVWRITSS